MAERRYALVNHRHSAANLLSDTLTAGDLLYVNASGELDLLGIGSANQVLTVSSGAPTWVSGGGGLNNVVEDTTPQLGGNLDVNGNSLVSTSNGNITLTPNGTGNVVLGSFTLDADQTVGAGQDNYVLTYDNGTGLISLEAASGGGASQLTDLSDVNTAGVTNRNVLVADGVDFESRALATADIQSGTFADARISESSVTQHEAAIDHDALTNFVANEHVVAEPAVFTYSTSQDITTTEATLNLDTEELDPDGNYANSSGEITVTTGGYFYVQVNIPIEDDGTSGGTRATAFASRS